MYFHVSTTQIISDSLSGGLDFQRCSPKLLTIGSRPSDQLVRV